MRTRWIVTALLALAGVVALWTWRADVAEDARRQAEAESSRVRAWARSSTAAGISVVPKRVPAADERSLRRLEEVPGFHEYAMRCSSCHVLPDPGAYDGRRWVGKVESMRRHIERAGVMPPPEGELEAVRGFLEAASDSLRRH